VTETVSQPSHTCSDRGARREPSGGALPWAARYQRLVARASRPRVSGRRRAERRLRCAL